MAQHSSATAQQKRKCPDEETSGLCASGCGFFGAAATGNMCSKCYRQHVVAAAASVSIDPVASSASPEKKAKRIVSVASPDAAAAAVASAGPSATTTSAKQPASRCAACRKKVGLLGFRCRCEATFCSVHRYSDKHDCGFDYKAAGQDKIAKQNPMVVADKITRF